MVGGFDALSCHPRSAERTAAFGGSVRAWRMAGMGAQSGHSQQPAGRNASGQTFSLPVTPVQQPEAKE